MISSYGFLKILRLINILSLCDMSPPTYNFLALKARQIFIPISWKLIPWGELGDTHKATHKANNHPAIFTDYRVKIGYRQIVISLPNISLPTFCAAMSFCKT